MTKLSTNIWGFRGSRVRDPFGTIRGIQTRIEDVSEEEVARRMVTDGYSEDLAVSTETLDCEIRRLAAAR